VAGKPIIYDASSLAGEIVEVSGGRARCRLCGRTVGLSMLKHHLQSRHCDKLLELLEKHKLVRMRAYGRGGASTFNIEFYCTRCGWRHSITVRSNTGPPNIRRLLEKLGLVSCPNCGKPFEVKGFEFK
jgi:DNA-directed RNA polymerase subunit RPC12/RpoP